MYFEHEVCKQATARNAGKKHVGHKLVLLEPFTSNVNAILMAGSLRAWLKSLLGKSKDFGVHGCGKWTWSFIRIAKKILSLAV